jgi:hypothetical protein
LGQAAVLFNKLKMRSQQSVLDWVSTTQIEDLVSKTVRLNIRVSAEPIAKWILANWSQYSRRDRCRIELADIHQPGSKMADRKI